ncbi:MAG: MgtC/SapB family protein [Acidobacteria bacterium]|nr:MgtC/SapB family protein [Acidobacteriota bacterium]
MVFSDLVWSDIWHLGLAYLLALPIGWNREKEGHSAGLRTFPIVSAAACGFAMLGAGLPGISPDSHSRMLQGLITGIGFIGGGAILRDKDGVTGTATAASVWNIGIVGAAVGLGALHIAVILTAINFLTFEFLTPLKRRLDSRQAGPDKIPPSAL